jgi:hypothetical protein
MAFFSGMPRPAYVPVSERTAPILIGSAVLAAGPSVLPLPYFLTLHAPPAISYVTRSLAVIPLWSVAE